MAVPELRHPPSAGGRAAAGLIPFGDGASGAGLLLIERAAALRKHARPAPFPRGAHAAAGGGAGGGGFREAGGGRGPGPGGRGVWHVLAVLPELYIWRSDFRVTPVLGWWRSPVPVAPGDPGEIAAVVRVQVADLASPANRLMIRYPGGHIGPAFRVAGLVVWG